MKYYKYLVFMMLFLSCKTQKQASKPPPRTIIAQVVTKPKQVGNYWHFNVQYMADVAPGETTNYVIRMEPRDTIMPIVIRDRSGRKYKMGLFYEFNL